MCNNCECENSYLCSIVGHMKYGACCDKCIHYDELHTCPFYLQEVIKPLTKEVKAFNILPDRFCLKMGKTPKKTIELYP
ncbi:MAG: hypothetical protein GF311_07410 [Candidatus Lokiarchaeota archaeon]|nr:hypothetical protein [Candidatus Lokiarchaeota archaeon]